MLDDDDGVTQVAQLLQAVDESLVVALVQTDRGLVQDVEYVHQSASYLRRQTDALALAAAEALAAAVQAQVTQTHRLHEPQACTYLLQYGFGDGGLFL